MGPRSPKQLVIISQPKDGFHRPEAVREQELRLASGPLPDEGVTGQGDAFQLQPPFVAPTRPTSMAGSPRFPIHDWFSGRVRRD